MTEPVPVVHERIIERPVPVHHVTERIIERPVEVPTPGPKPPVWNVRRQEPEQEVEPENARKELTPVKEKPLTDVKQKEPGKINENLSNQPQNDKKPVKNPVNFSQAPTAKKLPKKMQFKGKKGRQRTEAEVIDLLTFVQNRNGAWPNDNYVSDQMRRYYRREYPEYFRKGRKGKKVQSHGSPPIDLSTRRSGTGV